MVKAYQYTSITSVMLLDCWSIPSVILLTWLFLKTKYRFKKIAGVAICVAGLVLVIFSDVHAADRSREYILSYPKPFVLFNGIIELEFFGPCENYATLESRLVISLS